MTSTLSLEAALAKFGHAGFREGQRAPIEAVLRGDDAVVVMPTGSGKSLCYQVAALALPGTTLVISPLIALMHDQVEALARKGIPGDARQLDSRQERNGGAALGHGERRVQARLCRARALSQHGVSRGVGADGAFDGRG